MPLYTFTVSGAPTATLASTGIGAILINGNIVQVQNTGGALPAPLAAATNYYVVAIATNTLSLSLTPGGAAITLTTNGSGTNQIIDAWLGHYATSHALSAADINAMLDQDNTWPGPVNAGGFGLYNVKEIFDPSGNAATFSSGLLNFAPQTPGVALTAGVAAMITLAPVPAGVNGSDANHRLWISGGTGTAEAVLITGGTAVAGAASGTITFTPANNHSGAWTISSVLGGLPEAVQAVTTAGGGAIPLPAGTFTALCNNALTVSANIKFLGAGEAATILKLGAGITVNAVINCFGSGNTVHWDSIGFDGNRANNPSTASAFLYYLAARPILDHISFTNINANGCVRVENSTRGSITNIYGENNFAHLIVLTQAAATFTEHSVHNVRAVFSSYAIATGSNATPVVMTTSAPHGFITGQSISQAGCSVAALNNQWSIHVLSPTTYSLDGSTASGASTGGTVYEGNFALQCARQQLISVSGFVIHGGGEGIQISSTSYSSFSNIVAYSCRDAAVTVFGSAIDGASIGNTLDGIKVRGAYFEGIYLGDYAVNTEVSGCNVTLSGQSGIVNRGSGVVVWGANSSGNMISGRSASNPEYGINVRANVVGTRIEAFDGDNNTLGRIIQDGTDVGTKDLSYDTGTWTPADASGAGLVFTSVSGTYVKIGKRVTVVGTLVFPSTSNGATVLISLPFTPNASRSAGSISTGASSAFVAVTLSGGAGFQVLTSTQTAVVNSALSSNGIIFTITYITP